jgi:cell wall-associated NlpC family hydrolase
VAAGVFLAVADGHHGTAGAAPGKAAATAIAYAQAQLGKPYEWGGTGPGVFDCSGLVMEAYAAAGISIARTSQAQWATEQQVSTPEAGDLVFFPGADGTPTSPGHVGIVVDPARSLMIDAYASGFPVEYDTYGRGAPKPGLGDPVGFTHPAGGA